MKRKVTYGTSVVLLFVLTAAIANWLTTHFGMIHVGFGLTATAGTLAAGLSLTLRDVIQDVSGGRVVFLAILGGAILSLLTSNPALALASGTAFFVSEIADYMIYTPLRNRGRILFAVFLSNTVGAIVDTFLFLTLAFGASSITLISMLGQLVGKTYVTVATLVYVTVSRWAVNSGIILRKSQHRSY